MLYGTVVADPPWPYTDMDGPRASPEHRPNSWDRIGGSASSANRYGSMSIQSIKELKPPVAEQAHLYLWTTNSFLVEAHEVASAWGFVPKTVLTWVKVKPDGTPSMKMGWYYRGATEHILFAVRGKRLWPSGLARPTAYLLPREPHSRKPDFFYNLSMECSPGPYLEMFARRLRVGWASWGNEVRGSVDMVLETKE